MKSFFLYFSPGSIAVRFKMLHDYRYKKSGRTAPQFAGLVKEHLIRAAPQTNLAIDSKTIEIHGKFNIMSKINAFHINAKTKIIKNKINTYIIENPDNLY